jgi:anti-sigma-K factor RskA
MNDDELHELIALLAVDGLTGREREEAEEMIEQRPELRRELDELRASLGVLAELERRSPPERLRGLVLAEVARTPQEAPAAPDVTTAAEIVPIERARRRHRPWLFAAAAAAVVALAAGALIAGPLSDDDGLDDQIAAVVEAPDAVTIEMPGELPGLTIVHSAEQNASVLLADEVPVPAEDRVYELWAVRDGTPEPYTTFRPDDDGTLAVYAEGLVPSDAEAWAVSEEPKGGSTQPTPPILNVTA